jgi:hypothetical protein
MNGNFASRLFNSVRNYFAVVLQQGRVQLDADSKERFFGIYRGIVASNIDPQNLMRLQVTIPDVLGQISVFARPCVPAVDSPIKLPAEGTGVWIIFEGGDPNRPVWMGSLNQQT